MQTVTKDKGHQITTSGPLGHQVKVAIKRFK